MNTVIDTIINRSIVNWTMVNRSIVNWTIVNKTKVSHRLKATAKGFAMAFSMAFSMALLGLLSINAAAAPYIVTASTTSFGAQIIPVLGSCDMDYSTSVLTNVTNAICASTTGGSRGHYKVFATPNTTVRIVVRPHNNDGNGAIFNPVGVVFSDVSAPVPYIEHNTININSGTSGIVEIYVGGRLSLVSKPTNSTTFILDFDIDFSEI